MWHGAVERGPLAVPSRMLKLQFILSTLELGLKENGEIRGSLLFSLSSSPSHQRSSFMKTSPGALGILFSPDAINTLHILLCVYMHALCTECMWSYHVQMHMQFHAMPPFNMSVYVCRRVCAYVCVCVLRSVPLCFASVQKGLVPTTWCRAASAQPIPAWIATLAANQKLPAAFAVCPLSIFSNASLNLLASLGCCIKTPPFHTLPNYKFLTSALK